MANIIAVIWDCDKTLVDGYMQDPIFEEYGINPKEFWDEVNSKPKKYREDGIRVNSDTYYLNHFIKCAHNGIFPGLSNKKLREYGKKQRFYKGIPEIFEKTKEMFKDDKKYAEYGIQVEHYIVSTGFAEIIRGSALMPFADGPSDIPAFSVVKKNGGATFAIYPKGDMKAMQQVEQMREDVETYEEAVRKQAALAEQARLKEQAAKEQESKAKSIKNKQDNSKVKQNKSKP